MRKLKLFIIFFSASLVFLKPGKATKIGIIVPMQHTAMDEIVAGFKETMEPYLSKDDEVIVKNANSDRTIQQQIITQMNNSGVDYYLPIGTSTSQMTLSIVKAKPVICIAAMMDPKTFHQVSQERVGVINDEIEVTHLLEFIKTYLPEMKRLGIIYSNSEKIFPEIKQAENFCQKNNLHLVSQKVDSIAEVYQFAQTLIPQVDAILVLKDHTVVSAISGLADLAKKHNKLLIAMDDGSVKNGAHFGLGVREKDIGVATARVLVDALKGNKEKAFKITTLDNLSLFYNENSLGKQTMYSLERLKDAAKANGYSFDHIDNTQ